MSILQKSLIRPRRLWITTITHLCSKEGTLWAGQAKRSGHEGLVVGRHNPKVDNEEKFRKDSKANL